ncbi:katanin p80 WD40 repeat-containing subunit B1 homolog isoform X1 [Tanacetum coccineum]
MPVEEFVAHTANVNCLRFGKKSRRNFITGGDDEKVNLWSIGKPTAITSLSGHTSPIESVAFDSKEVLVAAGASSGLIKLWDLEETKVVRSLNGHRSYCTSLEFHPFGEFFASGSMDTNLKIWDIRKKGCIHTYKGHRRAVSTIRFSPDGRWVVSGGLDNVVKIWDLTAGKLLHEFKFHEGHIRSMDFHPLECLLATGSSDKTVKFWDLETFELIGSTRPEASGVRSVTFHPDGRTLFCGLDSSLKVYSWEPVICHDALDMGWSTLGDLCIDDGKLLGCSYYQNSVAVWVADTTLIEPHGKIIVPGENTRVQTKFSRQQDLTERVESPRTSAMSSDDDTKDIKNIYVDSVTHVASKKSGPVPTVVNSEYPKDIDNLAARKLVPASKITGQAKGFSFVPGIVPQDNSARDSAKSRRESIVAEQDSTSVSLKPSQRRESIVNEQDNIAVSLKPSHRRKPSATKLDIEGLSVAVESGLKSGSNTPTVANFQKKVLADDAAKDETKEKAPITAVAAKEFQKASSPGDRSVDLNKEAKSVKYVNGVAVVHGRTRSLVERFEKREKLNTDESQIPDLTAQQSINTDMPSTRVEHTFDTVPLAISEAKTSPVVPLKELETKTSPVVSSKEPEAIISQMPVKTPFEEPEAETPQMPVKTPFKEPETIISQVTMKTPFEYSEAKASQMPLKTPFEEPEAKTPRMSLRVPFKEPDTKTSQMSIKAPDSVSSPGTVAKLPRIVHKPDSSPVSVVQRPRTAPSVVPEKGKASPMPRSGSSRRLAPERVRPTPMLVTRRSNASPRVMPERTKISPVVAVPRHETPKRMVTEKAKSSPLLDDCPETTGRGFTSKKDDNVAEDLMLNHDVFVTTLRSRLTKLQVVRHFWEKSDTRGAINALGKLPDHAVQADVVNVLTERMESLTLDHFSSMLSVLMDLLDSSTERHINVSLEMLLKLVAVFGPVVKSTVSAPPTVGVDLHAEKRRECCKECHVQLQKIHKCLPDIIRRGGFAARCAQELNVILQNS